MCINVRMIFFSSSSSDSSSEEEEEGEINEDDEKSQKKKPRVDPKEIPEVPSNNFLMRAASKNDSKDKRDSDSDAEKGRKEDKRRNSRSETKG